jgi:hypothetical protein
MYRVLLFLPGIATIASCYTELAILAPLLRADLRQIVTLTDPVIECRNKHLKKIIGGGGVQHL